MAQIACPTCGNVFEIEQSRAMPFCSLRCKQIDLGRWLNEEQRVPYEDMTDPDEAPERAPPVEPVEE